MLTKLLTFFRELRKSRRNAKCRILKLETLFREGNVLRDLDGSTYRVMGSEMCFAILLDFQGTHHIVDWLTPAGTIRDEVADRFDIIKLA